MRPAKRSTSAFALYEVILGVSIFVIGVLALGRAAENCLNASTLSAEEDRVRQVLSNRMAEIQTAPGNPDPSKELKIKSDFGVVRLIQKSSPAGLKQEEVAQRIGSDQSFVSRYERGERRLDLVELEVICAACEMKLVELVRRFTASKR